jgi:hypothetical protein
VHCPARGHADRKVADNATHPQAWGLVTVPLGGTDAIAHAIDRIDDTAGSRRQVVRPVGGP